MLSGVLGAVFLSALLASLALSPEARIGPVLIAIPGLILSIMQFVADLRSGGDTSTTINGSIRNDATSAFWLGVIAIACILTGLVYGAAAGIFAYARFRVGKPFFHAMTASLVFAGLLYVGFERALGLALFSGVLFN